MKFEVDSFPSSKDVAHTNIQSENYQRGMPLHIRLTELWFLITALLNNVFYQGMKVQVDSFYNFEVMAQTKIQTENKRRAITQKNGVSELWFLCTVLLHNLFYQCVSS